MIVDVRYYCGWTDGRCYVIIRLTILSIFFKIPPFFFLCNVLCIQFASLNCNVGVGCSDKLHRISLNQEAECTETPNTTVGC